MADRKIYGGYSKLDDTSSIKGAYATNPAAQVKHYTGKNPDTGADPQDTQARIYLSVPPGVYNRVSARLKSDVARMLLGRLAGDGYMNFLLQSVSESYSEKVQVTEFLSDDFVAYYFGTRAGVLQFSGVLYNTVQDDWWDEMYIALREILRGTQLARYGNMVHVRYGSRIASGAINDMSFNHSSDMQMAANFSFSLLIKELSVVGTKKFPDKFLAGDPVWSDFLSADESAGFDIESYNQQLYVQQSAAVLSTLTDYRRPPVTAATNPKLDSSLEGERLKKAQADQADIAKKAAAERALKQQQDDIVTWS